MRTALAAIGLLTRVPVPAAADAETAGRAMRWFPLAGALIGAIYAGVAWLGMLRLPALLVAVLVTITEAVLTGALHMDGLADTADGFGGGKTREDILRIMRDPSIGSYGAVALVLLVVFKIAAIAALLGRRAAPLYLVLAAALGRWTAAPLSRFLPYARPSQAAPVFVGNVELIWSTLFAVAIVTVAATVIGGRQALSCFAAAGAATAGFGAFCHRKIGGITGDTLGAAIEISECLVLLVGVVG
jgi:adenosylcobinamide-GDP ribazoletransferase